MSGLSLGTCASNLRSVALTVLELLQFKVRCAQTDRHTDRHTSDENIISVIYSVHLASKSHWSFCAFLCS